MKKIPCVHVLKFQPFLRENCVFSLRQGYFTGAGDRWPVCSWVAASGGSMLRWLPGSAAQRPRSCPQREELSPWLCFPFLFSGLHSLQLPAVADFEPWDSSSLHCTFWLTNWPFHGQIVLCLEKYSYCMFYSTEPSRVKCSLDA